MTDRAFLYTCNRHFPLKYLHQVGRSLASANLLVSPAYGQELYVGVDDGADSGSADTGVPADRFARYSTGVLVLETGAVSAESGA